MSSPRRPTVLTALPDAWDPAVVAALGSRVTVGRRCVDLPDLMAAAEAGLGDVALVSPRLRGLDLSAVRELRLASVGVVGVVEQGDEAGETRLRQIGVRVFVAPEAPPADLFGAVVAALAVPRAAERAEPEAAAPSRSGAVVVVCGTHGAPGRTTVAVTLAAELARLGRRVVLVDLDTHAASVAQHLAVLDEAPGVAAACRAAEHGSLDVAALGRLAPEVLTGVRVLTGLPAPERWPEARGAAVARVLEVCALDADVVLVDVAASLEDDEELSYDTNAPRRNMAALAALDLADALVVVGAADPVGLQRLVRLLHQLDGEASPAPGVQRRVVVNRVRAGVVGPRPSAQVASVLSRFAGVEGATLVPLDLEHVDAALLAGQTLCERSPSGPARAALAGLARELVRMVGEEQDQPPPSRTVAVDYAT